MNIDERLAADFVLLDATNDGYIDHSDLELLAIRMTERLGLGSQHPQRRDIIAAFAAWWEQLREELDTDGDGLVSHSEFVAGFAGRGDDYLDRALLPLATVVFSAVDRDGDGRLDVEEYLRLFESAGVARAEAIEGFRAMDADGDGAVSLLEFQRAVREFFTSDDPKSVGALLLG